MRWAATTRRQDRNPGRRERCPFHPSRRERRAAESLTRAAVHHSSPGGCSCSQCKSAPAACVRNSHRTPATRFVSRRHARDRSSAAPLPSPGVTARSADGSLAETRWLDEKPGKFSIPSETMLSLRSSVHNVPARDTPTPPQVQHGASTVAQQVAKARGKNAQPYSEKPG